MVSCLSLYKSACLSVSESVWMLIPLLLQNGKPQQAKILRDDSSGYENVLGKKISGFVEPLAGN